MDDPSLFQHVFLTGPNLYRTKILDAAISLGNINIAKLALSHGAQINECEAMTVAIQQKNKEMLQLCFEWYVQINEKQVYEAIKTADLDIIRLVYDEFSKQEDDSRMSAYDDFICKACCLESPEILRFFVGKFVDKQQPIGNAATRGLVNAVKNNRVQVARILIEEYGADATTTCDENGFNTLQNSLLKMAIENRSKDMIVLLLPLVRDIAVQNGFIDFVRDSIKPIDIKAGFLSNIGKEGRQILEVIVTEARSRNVFCNEETYQILIREYEEESQQK